MTQATEPESLEVSDLHQFVAILSAWHSQRVKRLQHLVSIPEGTAMQLDDSADVPLAGDLYRGFQAGLTVALAELGKLPFVAELNKPADEEPQH